MDKKVYDPFFSTLFLAQENSVKKEEKEEKGDKGTPGPYLLRPNERISARKRRRQIHQQLSGKLERPPLTFSRHLFAGKKRNNNDFLKVPSNSQRAFQYFANLKKRTISL